MPCDTISSVTVTFQANTDLNLLAAALNHLNLGARVVGESVVFQGGRFQGGRFAYDSTYYNRVTQAAADAKVAEIKRAYSGEVIKSQAKRYGWLLKETAPYTYEVLKR